MMKKLDTHTQFITKFDGEIRVLSYFIRGDFGGGTRRRREWEYLCGIFCVSCLYFVWCMMYDVCILNEKEIRDSRLAIEGRGEKNNNTKRNKWFRNLLASERAKNGILHAACCICFLYISFVRFLIYWGGGEEGYVDVVWVDVWCDMCVIYM